MKRIAQVVVAVLLCTLALGARAQAPGQIPLPQNPIKPVPPPKVTTVDPALKINADDYMEVLPGCYFCRIALGYLVKDYRAACKLDPTVEMQRKLLATPNYTQMLKFVQETERNDARGRFSNLLPGDKQRAYVMKARFLIENSGCAL